EYAGRFAEAIASYGSSLKLRAELATLSHPDNVNTLALLSMDYAETGPPAAALDYALAGGAGGESMVGTPPKTGFAHVALATALAELDDDAAALEELDHARQIFEATRPPDHPNLGLVHTSLGVVLARLGRTEDALRHARHGYDVYRRAFG